MKTFMKDSDLYFKIVFVIRKRSKVDEKEDMLLPKIIRIVQGKLKQNEERQSDMSAIIFFRYLQYYDKAERVDELLESRKNLVEML